MMHEWIPSKVSNCSFHKPNAGSTGAPVVQYEDLHLDLIWLVNFFQLMHTTDGSANRLSQQGDYPSL
jgi:hypothetical protein